MRNIRRLEVFQSLRPRILLPEASTGWCPVLAVDYDGRKITIANHHVKFELGLKRRTISGLYMGRRTQIISVSPPLNVFILEKPELESLRDEIDQIDEQVVNLLNKRVRAAAEIGKIKHEMGDPYDPSVKSKYLKKLRFKRGSIPHDSLRAIYSGSHFLLHCLGKGFDHWLSWTGSNIHASGGHA